MSNTLYEIKNEYLEVLNNITVDEDGVIENLEELEALEAAFEDKAEAVACFIKNQSALADAIKTEEKSLAERRKRLEKRNDNLKEYLASCLNDAGRDKVETAKCKLSFRKSVSVEVLDLDALPAEYKREKVTVEPDKMLIKDDIKNGVIVEGAKLVENRSLQIK